MYALFAAFTILTAAPAWAQQPSTGVWNNTKGEVLGTVTNSGGRLYLRNTQGELVATIVFEQDGTRTIYDPNGKVLDRIEK